MFWYIIGGVPDGDDDGVRERETEGDTDGVAGAFT